MKRVSYERVVQILQDYVGNDAEATEIDYVKDVLSSVCGVTKEEAESLGLGYLFDPNDYGLGYLHGDDDAE